MRVVIRGHDLPGRSFAEHANVHVGVQVGSDAVGLVPGDAREAAWDVDVRRVEDDFRGPAVHGRRGERFLYLTWGDVGPGGVFEMFRRAKLMLDRIDPDVLRAVGAHGVLLADVVLTDESGGPRCARVDPPAVRWSSG